MPREEDDLPGDDDEGAEEQPKPRAERPAGTNGKPAAAKERPRAAVQPDDEEEEESEEEEEDEEAAAHKHPVNLVRLARHFGIPQAEIDSTPTDQLLLAVRVEREAWAARKEAEKPKPEEKPAKKDDEDELDFEDEFEQADGTRTRRKAKLSDYNPATQHIIRKLKETEKKLAEKEKQDTERAKSSHFAMIEEGIEGLDDADFFGAGTIGELHAAGKEEQVARRFALSSVAGIKDGDSQRTIDRKLAAARAKLFGKKAATKKPKADEEDEAEEETGARPAKPAAAPRKRTKAERWEEGQVSRPRNRRGTPARSMEAANEALSQMMIEQGMDPGPRRSHAEEDTLGGDDDL